jgi:4-amino-4-deoxy-L-arabinose transferase-like glycosyltransferase
MERKMYITLILIFLVSAATRLVYLLRNQYFYWDEAVYLAMAEALSGNFYAFEFFRPPLWSLVLSIFPKTVFSAKAVSFSISIIAIPLIFWLARKRLGDKKALMITFFYAFNHFSLFYAGIGGTESLGILLLFISLISFYSATVTNNLRYWIVAGASFGLAVMTKHTAAFFIFPLIAYLLITSRLSQKRGFLIFILSSLIVLSPWLVAMQILFGNMFYPQLASIGTSTQESVLFYFEALPLFLGIQGLFLIYAIPYARKNRFVLLNLLVVVIGLVLLSLIGHKEVRYLMILLPGVISLEGAGLFYLTEKVKQVKPLISDIMVGAAVFVFAFVFLFAPVNPEDAELEGCISLAEPYSTENSLSTSAPFQAFSYKRGVTQLPWEPAQFSCELIHEYGADYVIYYEDWWFEQVKEDFVASTSQCLDIVLEEGRCKIYRVV